MLQIVGPGGINQNVDVKHLKEDLYECHFYPTKEGRYVIMVKFSKQDIPKAPFEILVGPRSNSPILAFGPGLQTGVVGYPAAFVVEMNGETGKSSRRLYESQIFVYYDIGIHINRIYANSISFD